MSKTYKTWEMIEELSKNPKKKFKPIKQSQYVHISKDGLLRWNDGETFKINIYTLNTNNGDSLHYEWEEWEEAKEPITWQEAIQAWVEGKTIYCILQDNQDSYKYIYSGKKRYAMCISRKEIVEGKWYIED